MRDLEIAIPLAQHGRVGLERARRRQLAQRDVLDTGRQARLGRWGRLGMRGGGRGARGGSGRGGGRQGLCGSERGRGQGHRRIDWSEVGGGRACEGVSAG